MSKLYNRSNYVMINKFAEDFKTKSLINEFEENLKKLSVMSQKKDKEYFCEYNTSRANYGKTVASVVEEMKERSGLNKYLKNVMSKSSNEGISKDSNEPQIFKDNLFVKRTIDSIIKDSQGSMFANSIIEKAKNIHNSEVNDNSLWQDPKLLRYVVTECKKQNSHNNQNNNYYNLGKSQNSDSFNLKDENSDTFYNLEVKNNK